MRESSYLVVIETAGTTNRDSSGPFLTPGTKGRLRACVCVLAYVRVRACKILAWGNYCTRFLMDRDSDRIIVDCFVTKLYVKTGVTTAYNSFFASFNLNVFTCRFLNKKRTRLILIDEC